jgi:undecaprenyl diphosphate synthase
MAIIKNKATNETLPNVLPKHIAFIMDGNGRWAKKRLLPRSLGHSEGGKTFKDIVTYCREIGIRYVSFYAFSTENWKRPKDEVNAIMVLFKQYIADARNYFKHEIRFIFLGDKAMFTPDIREEMIALEEDSKHFDKMTVLLAINYGGRDDIVHACKGVCKKVQDGEISIENIDEDTFEKELYTQDASPVDLLVRTSGEYRISNFLLWQCAYAEFYFTDVLWPDFKRDELDKALLEFANRNRRFGGV